MKRWEFGVTTCIVFSQCLKSTAGFLAAGSLCQPALPAGHSVLHGHHHATNLTRLKLSMARWDEPVVVVCREFTPPQLEAAGRACLGAKMQHCARTTQWQSHEGPGLSANSGQQLWGCNGASAGHYASAGKGDSLSSGSSLQK
ncbi:hypothetical protein CEXT_799861 [Caerostris extrusa]|uniref:Secreted protein n=1 Tax=Caerostris extrusa TaxID=172846 RepID=A0AAV4U027_CAEEX|nr:hypothetical protein CEXT_799861 [Caerostris extrusa]